MAAPSLTVTLSESGSGESISFRSPAPAIPVVVHRKGVTHETAGGGHAQYLVGAAWHEATLTIPHLTNAQKNSLESFFRSHWGKSTVSYTDENGNVFSGVRFLDSDLPLTKDQRDAWTCTLKLRLSSVLK